MIVYGVLQCGAAWCSALHVLQCVAVSTAVQIQLFKGYMQIQRMDVCSFVRIYLLSNTASHCDILLHYEF